MGNICREATLKEFLEILNPNKPVFLDTETSKLGSQIRLIQCYQSEWEQALLFNITKISLAGLWAILQPQHLILHNGTYDFGCFRKDLPEGVFVMPKRWDDTFYLSRITFPELNTQNGFSLDSCLDKVLGYDPYKKEGLNKKTLQTSFERIKVKDTYIEGLAGLRELTSDQLLYAAIDVYELPNLWEAVKHKVDEFVYQLDIETINHIQTDVKGLPLDTYKLQGIVNKDLLLIANIDKQLSIGFNVNSYLQVRKLLGTIMSSNEEALAMIQHRPEGLTNMGLRTVMTNGRFPAALLAGIKAKTISVETRKFGAATQVKSVDDLPISNKVLVYYFETDYVHSEQKEHIANLINNKRKALKRLNFADRAKKAFTVSDGIPRIRGTFSPHAINGRIQVDNENLSQYPRTMKSMWGHTSDSKRKLIYSDFAQIELRIICAALPEMNMYKALKEGTDLHTFAGNNLHLSKRDLEGLPDGITPRFVAKQCNFLLLYGGGLSNFQRTVCKLGGVWFGNDVAKKIITTWKDIFSDIKGWHETNSKSKTRLDKTISGRPYKAGTVTDLNNIRVSGSGSEIFKLWLHYIWKYITNVEKDVYIVNRVHDSVLLDVPDDREFYERLSKNLVLCGQKAWFEVIKNAPLVDVPMPCDVAVGNNWEDIENKKNLDYSYVLDGMYMYDKNLEGELL